MYPYTLMKSCIYLLISWSKLALFRKRGLVVSFFLRPHGHEETCAYALIRKPYVVKSCIVMT
jgi:hypothetical protein